MKESLFLKHGLYIQELIFWKKLCDKNCLPKVAANALFIEFGRYSFIDFNGVEIETDPLKFIKVKEYINHQYGYGQFAKFFIYNEYSFETKEDNKVAKLTFSSKDDRANETFDIFEIIGSNYIHCSGSFEYNKQWENIIIKLKTITKETNKRIVFDLLPGQREILESGENMNMIIDLFNREI